MAESRDVSSAENADQVGGRQEKDCETCRNRNKNTVAAWFCKTCGQYQCDECSKMHEVFNFMFGHEIIKPEEASSVKPVFDMKGLDKCKDHDKLFEFYCIDHRKLLCSSCAIVKHRGCVEVNEIASESVKQSGNTSDLQNVIQDLHDTAEKLSKLLSEIKTETHKKLEAVLNHIEDIKKKLMIKFDELKASVTEQFQCEERKQIQMLDSDITTTQKISEDLQQQKEFLMSAIKGGTEDQVFIAEHIVRSQVTPYKKIMENQWSSSYILHCFVEWYGPLLNALMSDVILARFEIDEVSAILAEKHVKFTQCLHASSSSPNTIIQMRLVNFVDLKQDEGDTVQPFYTGMDFFPYGRLAIVDNFNMKLHIVNQNLEKIGLYQFENYRYDVCVVSESEVVVTSGKYCCLEFLHVSTANDITLTKILGVTAVYDSICLMDTTTFLVSTIDDKCSLRMIDRGGKEEDFNNLNNKQYESDSSMITYMKNKSIAVLTDRFKNEVIFYDSIKKDVTRRVVEHEYILEPRGVCEGPGDSLFICSSLANSIVQVSARGEVVGRHKLDMRCPLVVRMSKDAKKLAVFNDGTENLKLQLFDLLY